MTSEEKAKAYDEALEAAKKELKQDLHESGVWAIKRIFPQLAESEDERIRKAILGLTYIDGIEPILTKCSITAQDIRAYLEKQKYDRLQPVYDNQESFESALEKAWNDYHNGYENVDKLEDDYIKCAHAKGFREGYLFGLEKQKEQQPAEWSEEDEAMRDNILRCLQCFEGTAECKSNPSLSTSYPLYMREIDWLKSLKNRGNFPPARHCASITGRYLNDYRKSKKK